MLDYVISCMGLELESPLSKDALCFVLCRQRKLVVVHFGRWICRVRHDYSVRYTPVVLQAAVKNKATSPSAEGDSAHCDRKSAVSFAVSFVLVEVSGP